MLKVLLGGEAPLKEELMKRASQALEKKERQLLIIVPAQATFLLNRQIIEECRVPGYMHVRAITFERLTSEILSREGGRAKKSISADGMTLMCADEIKRLGEETRFDLKKDPEIHKKTASFIRALMQEGITPERTLELSEKLGGTVGIKLKDTAKVYSAISERLNNTPGTADLEALAMGFAENCDYVKDSDFIIYRFDVFPKRRLEYILSIARATDVTLMLNGGEELSAVRRLVSMQPDILVENIGEAAGANRDTAVLAERLFNGAKKCNAVPEHIRLFHTKTKEEEVENAAVLILEYSKNHKIGEAAIVTEDIPGYAHIIKDVLRENGIPFYMGGKRSLSESKSAEFLLTALEAAKYRRMSDVTRYIKSGFTDITEDEKEAFVRMIYEYGLSSFGLFTEFKRAEFEPAEDIRKRAMSGLADLSEHIKSARKAAEYCTAVRSYIEDMKLPEKTKERAELFRKNGLAEEAAFEEQVMDGIYSILQQTEMLIESELTAQEFTDILSSGITGMDISTVPPMNDQVAVGSITHGIYGSTGLVIILGANDGILPSGAMDAGQLLLQHETELLREEEEFFPGTLGIDEQKLYIKRVISGAKEIAVSYNDEAGLPSYMVAQIKSIFPEIVTEEALLPVTVKGGVRMLARELRRAENGEDFELLPSYIKNPEARDKLTSLIPYVLLTKNPAKISGETAQMLYGGMKGSVSSIETYYKCPYKHFLDYGIRPQEMAAYEEDAASAGTYAHDVMEVLTRNVISAKAKWAELTDAELDAYVDEAAKQALEGHNRGIMEENGRFRYLAKRLRDEVSYSAKAIRDQLKRTDVQIAGSEMSFGFWNDFTVKTPAGEIAIRGKIDRLDVVEADGEKFIRVVDYKTGTKSFDMSELFYGVDIQLMVYLLAVLNISRYKNAVPAGGFYFKIDLPLVPAEKEYAERMRKFRMSGFLLAEKKAVTALDNGMRQLISMNQVYTGDDEFPLKGKDALTREEMADMLTYTKRLISDASAHIYGGNIEIKPFSQGGKRTCRYCPYLSVCRVDEDKDAIVEMEEKTKADILEELGK